MAVDIARTTMPRRRLAVLAACLTTLVVGTLILAALAAAPARALPLVGTVTLDAPAYTAHENQGVLAITIVKSNPAIDEHVGYGVKQQDGRDGLDFIAIPNTIVDIPPGQRSYTFDVKILDEGIDGTPVHALAYLFGAWPAPPEGGKAINAMITILHDDPIGVRDPANPLGVSATVPANGDPLAGAKLFVDPHSPAARAARRYARRRPAWARMLRIIADAPGSHRFWMWNMHGNIAGQVAFYLRNTQLADPGSTVMMTSYNLIHGPRGSTATPAVAHRYAHFMAQMARGIGNFHVVFFLELDSLIASPGLSRSQLAIRESELRTAVADLEAKPHVVVYLDGGAADALPAGRQAQLLRASGVGQAQGFFLNSTHFDWTNRELAYGEAVSRLLGGAHFVVNTSVNGRGPLRPRDRVHHGNEVLCNPPGRGLGPLSVTSDGIAQPTGYPGVDGFLWFGNPGNSGGRCAPGAPGTATFWPKYAVGLAQRWVDHPTGPTRP